MEVCPYSFFQWCRFRRSMGVMSSQWGSQNFFKDWHLMNSQPTIFFFDLFLTQWIMAILSKRCKPDNFEPHNSLKRSFTNIRRLRSNLLNVNVSFNQTLLTFLLYMRQTWMTQLILAIFSFNPERFYYSCMVLQFMWKKDFLLHGTFL